MTSFDGFRERGLKDVAGRVVIAKDAVDETAQLVGMFQEQRRDDAGIELRYVGSQRKVAGGQGGRVKRYGSGKDSIVSPAAETMKPR